MITFTPTEIERKPVVEHDPFSAPQAPARRRLLPYVLLAVFVFALGNVGTWLALRSMAPETPDVAAVTLPSGGAVTPAAQLESDGFRVEQFEDAVTRALTSQVHYEAMSAEEETVLVVSQADCTETLGDLATLSAASAVSDPVDRDTLLLDLARSIAREAVGCSVASITVQGHSAKSEDEVENLRASWLQAERTIATLAGEGLDVSLFRPLGFGSRALDGSSAQAAQNLSFHIAFNS